jgi:hypothetical protein
MTQPLLDATNVHLSFGRSPELPAVGNVAMPLLLSGGRRGPALRAAPAWLVVRVSDGQVRPLEPVAAVR